MFSWLKDWWVRRQTMRRFRFPALAEANKVLFVLESEVVDSPRIEPQINLYKKAQDLPEKDRDLAYIPIYFALETFIVAHQPPIVKESLSKEQLREKVRKNATITQLNEGFRLVFLPPNEQLDHLLKIGLHDLIQFLLVGLGSSQLKSLIERAADGTPLKGLEVTEDGVNFDKAHSSFQKENVVIVAKAYKQFYTGLFQEAVNLFGEKAIGDLAAKTRNKIKETYDEDLNLLFMTALPDNMKSGSTTIAPEEEVVKP